MLENIRRDFATHNRSYSDGGFWVMFVYRFGVWSMNCRIRPWRWFTSKIYWVLQRIVELLTGVHLTRGTKIGEGFHIVHTGRTNIHPDSVIGERCGVMHNVTIGTNMYGGCPTIGNDVFIGCGASVLGEILIGNNVRISANSLVITDIPEGAVAMGVPARAYPNMDKLRSRKKKNKRSA